MALIIKNVTVNWEWVGDTHSLKGYNIAITKYGETPNSKITALAKSDVVTTYTFSDVTLDSSSDYVAWVQALYDGADSEWVSTGQMVVSDDGSATIDTVSNVNNKLATTEQNANEYAENAANVAASKKNKNYTSQPAPPYALGDTWSQGSAGDMKICIGAKAEGQAFAEGDWDLASKYTDDTTANSALSKISDMGNDSKLTPVEKLEVKKERERISSEYTVILWQAQTFEIDGTGYVDAYKLLANYLDALLADMNSTSDIDAGIFTGNFTNYYVEKEAIDQLISIHMSQSAKWDNVEGAPTLNGIRNFAFEKGLDGWSYEYTGADVPNIPEGSHSIVTDLLGTVGGKVLRVDDELWIFGADAIPIDVNKKYKISAKVRVNAVGTIPNVFYLGCACLDANFNNIVEGVGSHRYAGADGVTVPETGEWVTYTGYISGIENNHNSFKTNTSYIRPCLILNYVSDTPKGDYIYDVDFVTFEELGDNDDLKEQGGWQDLPSDGATNNSDDLQFAIPEAQLKFGQDALGYNTHGVNITAGIGDGEDQKLTKFQIDSYTGNFTLESFGKVNIYNNKNKMYFDDEPDGDLNRSQILLNTTQLGDSDVVFRLGDSFTYTKADVLSFTNGSISLTENKTIGGTNYDYQTILNADTITSNAQSTSNSERRVTQVEGGDIFFSQSDAAGNTYSSRANIKLISGVVQNGHSVNLASETNNVAWENPQVFVAPLNFDINTGTKYQLNIAWSGNTFTPTVTGPSNSSGIYLQWFAYEAAGGAGTKYATFVTSEKTTSTQSYTFTVPHGFTDIKAAYSNVGTVTSWSVSGNKLTVHCTGSTNAITKTSGTQTTTVDCAWNESPPQSAHKSIWLTSPFPATYSGYLPKTGTNSKIYRSGTGSAWQNYTNQPTGTRVVAYSTGEYYSSGQQIGGTWYGTNSDSYEYRNVATGNTTTHHTDKYALGDPEERHTPYKRQRRLVGKRWNYSGTLKAYTYKYNITYLYVE